MLWEPSQEWVARTTLTRYSEWLESERGLSFGCYEELWRWSADDLDAFWSSIVQFFDVRFSSGGDVVLGDRSMPGAEWFPDSRDLLRRARVPRQGRRRGGDPASLRGAARAGGVDVGAIAVRDRADRRRAAGARCRAGRSGRRLHAEHPGDGGALSGVRVDRRDVVLGGARVRRAQRHRPLRADRAQGAAGDRRLPVRGQGLRPARDRRSGSRGDPSARARRALGYLDGSGWEDGFLGPDDAELVVRGAPVRPPAVGPLQLGHDGTAQADRPRPRRDPARAAQEDAPAPRRPGRRSRVLVLDDRLDDVELPRRGAA